MWPARATVGRQPSRCVWNLVGFLMFCSAPDCGKPAISLGLCIEHIQRPGRKRRMSAKRKATIEALAEKYVAAADPLPGQWPGLHYSMGRSYRKGGIVVYLRRWLLAHGTLPEGVHASSGTRVRTAWRWTSLACGTTQLTRWRARIPTITRQERRDDNAWGAIARS
jgi:hypothetical protein